MSTINLIVVKRGPTDLPKLTEKSADKPSTRGPKRANHIRKVWGLKKEDDVRQYVVRRKIEGKNGKPDRYKSPKIQRLITPQVRHNKARRLTLKKRRHEKSVKEASDYAHLLSSLRDQKRSALLSKKRELKSVSEKKSDAAAKAPTDKPQKAAKTTKPGAPKAETKKAAGAKTETTKKAATPKTAATAPLGRYPRPAGGAAGAAAPAAGAAPAATKTATPKTKKAPATKGEAATATKKAPATKGETATKPAAKADPKKAAGTKK